MKKTLYLFVITIFSLTSCKALPIGNGKPVTHEAWNKLLKKYVDNKGFVNYKGFIKDSNALNSYLNTCCGVMLPGSLLPLALEPITIAILSCKIGAKSMGISSG